MIVKREGTLNVQGIGGRLGLVGLTTQREGELPGGDRSCRESRTLDRLRRLSSAAGT